MMDFATLENAVLRSIERSPKAWDETKARQRSTKGLRGLKRFQARPVLPVRPRDVYRTMKSARRQD